MSHKTGPNAFVTAAQSSGSSQGIKAFRPFQLDAANHCLWKLSDAGKAERVPVTPKAFVLLAYLVERAGRLVTHNELLEAVWAGTVVEPQAVRKCVLSLRSALGDRGKISRFIETVTKLGYRFIAPVSDAVAPNPAVSCRTAQGILVGRAAALEELHERWQRALCGERQVVFLSGESGIGKTALAKEFCRQAIAGENRIHVALGQCIEGYGNKEPYGPILDALGGLCRGPQAEAIVRILALEAPTGLAQFPWCLTSEHREMLKQEILGATRERMLRELSVAFESIAADSALLLVLEDLQWMDTSTADAISLFARRRAPARLMVLATCRQLDSEPADHALKALMPELLCHKLCCKVDLAPLSEANVEQYLCDQSPACPLGLSALVHRHSGGNPLFMVAALEDMSKRGLLSHTNGQWHLEVPLEEIELAVPADLRLLIQTRLDRLSTQEQSALDFASIAGASFSTRVLRSSAEIDVHGLDELCADLARRHHILRYTETHSLPDGSQTESYEFVHALYRQVLYDRQSPARRARLHGQVGQRLEEMYAPRTEEVVLELANHFEKAANFPRAIEYLQRAAQVADRRYAQLEADAMLARALELAHNLPETQRLRTEPHLLSTLAAHRWAAFDARTVETFETLAARAAEYGLIDTQARALIDLSFLLSSTNTQRCLEMLQGAEHLSAEQSPAKSANTRLACAFKRLSLFGWNTRDAHEFQDNLAKLSDRHHSLDFAPALLEEAWVRWLSGEYREALRLVLEVRAKLVEHPEAPDLRIGYVAITILVPLTLMLLGEWGKTLNEFATAIAQAEKNSSYQHSVWLQMHRAWLHVHCLDFNGALAICEQVLQPHTAHSSSAGPLLPSHVALICSGSAFAALGEHARAQKDLERAKSEMDSHSSVLDWYWRMPLAAGMTELWLEKGDRARARLWAEQLLQVSLVTAERTWQALAWEINARVALANRDSARAQECIVRALSTVEGFEVPLAHWRVHATAARIAGESDNRASASLHRAASRTTIMQLADSLSGQELLRKTFLSAPAVAMLLAEDQTQDSIETESSADKRPIPKRSMR